MNSDIIFLKTTKLAVQSGHYSVQKPTYAVQLLPLSVQKPTLAVRTLTAHKKACHY
ncbi:hypothetical protein [Halalkalibacter okhensis]|uniref:hypothetical protein n=1 Tax=Halalkalibacter okhensis TaxID=333138 RepID=UPI001376BDA5|nr:hypothetical protein [Halalkalibacter okhensis]